MPTLAAHVRIFAAEPALAAESAEALGSALTRLMHQFVREGRCVTSEVTSEARGRFVAIAWEGQPLSGCSHDKIAQVVAHHERQSGVVMLDAPPIALGEPIVLTDRSGLRTLLAQRKISGATPVWPRWAQSLGEWRAGPVALSASPFARLLS